MATMNCERVNTFNELSFVMIANRCGN